MFSKNNLISTIVTAIWAFFGGYILWGILTAPFLKEHLGNGAGPAPEEPNFMYLALGCLLMSWAFSTIYSKWARGAHSASQGIGFGFLVGILLGFGNGFIDYATVNLLDITGTIVNGAVYIVFFVVMGILASMVHGKLSRQ